MANSGEKEQGASVPGPFDGGGDVIPFIQGQSQNRTLAPRNPFADQGGLSNTGRGSLGVNLESRTGMQFLHEAGAQAALGRGGGM